MNQEQLIQLQVIEQETQQLEQQSQLIEQSLIEMQNLSSSLDELEKTDKKEIFANIGRGIYVPAEIKDKTLSVEVGNKVFVKKSIPETKKIIEDQVQRLGSAREQIFDRIEDLKQEVNQLMRSEKSEDKKKEKE
ncbi:MAG: prefoldin subunit alpha [Nanoarchaeota archaeon]|nr:prefoldin subunit alpha [Nanoarchaeota archaeon]